MRGSNQNPLKSFPMVDTYNIFKALYLIGILIGAKYNEYLISGASKIIIGSIYFSGSIYNYIELLVRCRVISETHLSRVFDLLKK
jgi:uncharacterized membrane protein YgdD (TMEM256/DUF423 family)